MTTYEISVSNPWFDYIKNKKKKVEGRLNKNIFAQLKKGDIVIFTNNDMKIKTKIKRITKYKSFNDYLMQEGLRTTLPNIKTIVQVRIRKPRFSYELYKTDVQH
jgi:ASC-1-like (ASCH) protein